MGRRAPLERRTARNLASSGPAAGARGEAVAWASAAATEANAGQRGTTACSASEGAPRRGAWSRGHVNEAGARS